MGSDEIVIGLAWYAVFVISLSWHEGAHAFTAYILGDKTAYHNGQVTLNPIAHIKASPIGTVVVPLLSYAANGFLIGWASTPYDPEWARRHPKRDLAMTLAGPTANLLLVIICAVIIRAGIAMDYFFAPESITFTKVTAAHGEGWVNSIAVFVSIGFTLNLILFIFNLFPVPPLDGSAFLPYLVGRQNYDRVREFMANPAFIIIGFLAVSRVFMYIFDPVHLFALNLLYPGANYGY